MSLSFQQLKPVCVLDPRVMIQNEREYAVLKSGSQVSWKQWTSTSVSTTSINFSCPPPSGNIIVDRKIYLYLCARLTFTGVPANGKTLLNVNRDAPRAFPIGGSLETIQATINNQTMSYNCADTIHALMHFNNNVDLKNGDYSLTPNYPDQAQNYSELFGTIRSPLQNYGDSLDGTEMNRGGFPFVIISNPVGNGTDAVTSVLDVQFCEPIFMAPFFFGKDNSGGFFNVNSMDFTFNFVSQLANRMWSHDNNRGTSIITSSTAAFGSQLNGPTSFSNVGGNAPLMLIQYITPQETMVLSPSMAITYPYFDVQRFITDVGSVGAGVRSEYNSNNVQLASIPRRLYIYMREKNSDLYSNADRPDTYFQINSINIQFLNKNGLLASASMMDLYKMSRKNHCNLSWTQWAGKVYKPGNWGEDPAQMGLVGSVLCIEFAYDVGLEALQAPGKLEQCQLQVTVSATNISDRAISASLLVVPILEGTFSILGLGQASVNIGVISSKDILDCQQSPAISYNDVQHVNGGDFWSGLKEFGSKIANFFKKNKIISTVLKSPLVKGLDIITGLPISKASQALGQFAESKGWGEDEAYMRRLLDAEYGHGMSDRDRFIRHRGDGEGEGVLVGGRTLKRSQLKKRLH